MSDRREPVARALLARIECDFAPHIFERLTEQVTAELARTPDTESLVIELPASHGAKLRIRGFPPTIGQRVKRALAR